MCGPAGRGGVACRAREGAPSPTALGSMRLEGWGTITPTHVPPDRSPQHRPGCINTQLRKGSWSPTFQTSWPSVLLLLGPLCSADKNLLRNGGLPGALRGSHAISCPQKHFSFNHKAGFGKDIFKRGLNNGSLTLTLSVREERDPPLTASLFRKRLGGQ